MDNKSWHHICIQTGKYYESMQFYTQVLGFEVVKESKDFHSRAYNTWLKLGGIMIELQTPKMGEILNEWSSSNSGPVHLCFLVENIHDEYNRIKNLGYKFKTKNGEEIYRVENGYLFKVKAPEGTEVEIRDQADL